MTLPRYAAQGRLGVATPQANPTVEDEFRILLPPTVAMNVSRLTSTAHDPMDRLRLYMEQLDQTLATYDTLKLSALGIACTGSSYLLGRAREEEIVQACSEKRGYPVITAAEAIIWALDRLNARRIVVIAPYPAALLEAGHRYFESRGLTVVAEHRIETATADTRGIYDLGWPQAQAKLAELDLSGVDAVLLSGTGMPGLPVVAAGHASGLPVISSNLCLAARLMSQIGHDALLDERLQIAGWKDRLAAGLA